MAGHSKWANIKHKKAAQDAKRGKIFTKIIREIVVAARSGGGNPEDNPRLRAVIDKALAANMKRDTIDKAVARGSGDTEGDNYEEITYEGYGSGGVAVLVECMTDNRNRTVAEIRHAFSKRGGNLGTDGSVAYLFEKRGQLSYPPGIDEEKLMEQALDSGADDIQSNDDGSIDVLCPWEDYTQIKSSLMQAGLEPEHSEVTMLATTLVPVEDQSAAETVIGLVEQLEDLDDVQNVYTNADIDSEIIAQIEE